MNILLVYQYFHDKEVIGGSRFNEMCESWARQGHKVTVLGGIIHYASKAEVPEGYKGKFLVREQYDENIEVIRCYVSPAYNASYLGRFWGYLSFVISSILGGIFKARSKFDMVLVSSPNLLNGITGYVLSRWKRIPLVFEIRDLWPESAIDTGVLKNKRLISFAYWLEGFIYRKSSLINVLTPAFREKLIEHKNVAPEKIVFIPNATDFNISDELHDSFDPQAFKKELGLEDKVVIIYVGAHGVANHLVQVLDTAELIEDTNAVFLLVGGGNRKDELVADAKKRGIKNVVFKDPVPKKEIMKYIMAADIGTSVLMKVDTFKTIYSNKTFDYMGCKKPILMAIDGVSRKLVEDADCGIYVEPENPQDFADKIRYYLANPDLLPKHGENGYNYAKANFDRMVLAEKYMEHLEDLVNKPK